MSTRRRVEFELVGTGANIEAILNRITAGINRVGTSGRSTNKELGLIDKQLMAIGTTMRYAFAGGIIFGITGAIGRLTEFQNKLGQVAALAGQVAGGRYQGPSGNLLGDIGSNAIIESNKLGIAVNDVQDYMTRFYSSFDQARGRAGLDQMRQYVDAVGRLQQALGTEAGDPQQLAGGIAGLVNQIPGGTQNIGASTNRISNLIWTLLASTPNITGRDIARDIGRVGATMTIANMTPEQAFSVWASAGTAGGSSSVIGRGIAQLLGTSLLHPSTPAQIQAFRQAGLPTDPTMLRQMGGWRVLMQMMQAVAPNGARISPGQRRLLGNEDITDEEALAGGVPGVNLTLLYNLLGRQESVRQFVNLLGNNGANGLQRMFKEMASAVQNNTGAQREAAALQQRSLQVLGTAIGNVPLSVIRGPLNAAARPGAWAATHVSNALAEHRTTTTVIEGLFGAALGVAGARRLWRGWRQARGRGVGGASSAMLGNAIMAEELPQLIQGGVPDGSRGNPFWVMISPASWYVGVPGGNPMMNPGGPGGPGGAVGKRFRFPTVPVLAGGAATAAALVLASKGSQGPVKGVSDALKRAAGFEDLHHYVNLLNTQEPGHFPKPVNPIIDQFMKGKIGARRAETLLDALDSRKGQGVAATLFGHASGSMDVTVRLVDAQGRTVATQKKGGVPVKWKFPDTSAPTSQGNNGARKGKH